MDELGGLDKALEIAIAKAGVDAYTVMSYPKKEGFLESLMNTNPGNYIKGRMLNGKMSDMYRQFSIIENFDKIYDFWQLNEKNQKQEKMEIKILNKIYKNTCFFETVML